MQSPSSEDDEIQRQPQARKQPEAWATHDSAEYVHSSDDESPHLNQEGQMNQPSSEESSDDEDHEDDEELQRSTLFSNEALEETRSGYRSRFGIMETDKLGKEAHELDDLFSSSKRLPTTAGSSNHAKQGSRSKMSIKARFIVADFIQKFVKALYETSGQVLWQGGTNIQRPYPYVQVKLLEDTLELYATLLLSISTTVVNDPANANEEAYAKRILVGAVLVQQYKFQIAHLLPLYLSAQYPSRIASFLNSLQQTDPPDFSPQRLGLKTTSVGISSVDHVIDLSDILNGPIDSLILDNIMMRLDLRDEMRLLTKYVRHGLYRDGNTVMRMIEAAMSKKNLDYIHRDGYKAQIIVPWWSIRDFMNDQYGDISRFGSVVTLTGCSNLNAQASTCADYVRMTWPETGEFFLELLDAIQATIVASDAQRPVQVSLTSDRGLSVRAEILRHDVRSHASLAAEATNHDLLIQLGQQLSWLSSAFTVSPFKEQLAYSSPYLFLREHGVFEITVGHEPIDDTKQACWLSLFNHACLVAGFPIAERAEEIGLELSLDLLAGLSGARHVFEYEGGLVMKGFSHMFVPVRRQFDRVQWHAVSSPDEETPLSYHDGLSRCASRATLDEVSLQDLASLRTIVGWCSVATTCLGSSHVDYENIDYTKTKEADSGPRCTGTSFGFQQIGVAALDVRFGLKDGKSHFQRAGPYQRTIQLAEGSPIVLHDVEGRRSWLVPATNVMLHIVQHRHHLNPFQVNGKPINLDTNVAAGSSAEAVLLNNRTQVLYEDDGYTFGDDILNTWSILELLLDQNVSRQREAPGIRIPTSVHEKLYGFEFKSVVNQDGVFKLKKTTISRDHGGWSKLIEEIDALVLFANGFGDVILPAGGSCDVLCHKWRRVPDGQDYLTTTTDVLRTLFDKAGSRVDRKYLTTKSKLRWHQGSSALFNECQNVSLCDCTRLQQLVPESAFEGAQPPAFIADEGAVIFGHPEPRPAPPRPTVPKISGSLYSQPNVPILPRVVRRRSSTNDERKGKTRRLDIEAEELNCEHNQWPQATS
ncbi:unnamed protein product [Alternaria alternata]